jgi:hypothetical protein
LVVTGPGVLLFREMQVRSRSTDCENDSAGIEIVLGIQKKGTWWVYQDTVSGLFDTVTVMTDTSYHHKGILSSSQREALCEALSFTSVSSLDGDTYAYWIDTEHGGNEVEDYNVVFCSRSSFPTRKCFIYPFIHTIYAINVPGLVDSVYFKESYASKFGFNNVVRFGSSANDWEGMKRTFTYYAPNIGLIRYEVPDSNKYRILVDYYIEP